MALLMLLRRMGRARPDRARLPVDLPRLGGRATTFPAEVAEMALAHVVGDKVEAAYRRGDLFQKRRQLAEAWATYCDSPVPSAEVVPIRANGPKE